MSTDTGACFDCGRPSEPVFAVERRGAPHGEPGHNVVYSVHTVGRCARGHGVLDHHDHDCWSHDEPWDLYWWFALDTAAMTVLAERTRACPTPLDATCSCAAHQSLRESASRLWATPGARSRGEARAAARVEVTPEGPPRFVLVAPSLLARLRRLIGPG